MQQEDEPTIIELVDQAGEPWRVGLQISSRTPATSGALDDDGARLQLGGRRVPGGDVEHNDDGDGHDGEYGGADHGGTVGAAATRATMTAVMAGTWCSPASGWRHLHRSHCDVWNASQNSELPDVNRAGRRAGVVTRGAAVGLDLHTTNRYRANVPSEDPARLREAQPFNTVRRGGHPPIEGTTDGRLQFERHYRSRQRRSTPHRRPDPIDHEGGVRIGWRTSATTARTSPAVT